MVTTEATVKEKTLVTEQLGLFRLTPVQALPDFIPGQFMMVGTQVDGKLLKRAYSIVSAPSSKHEIEFCIKAYEEGKVAKHLLRVPEGAKLMIDGPYGKFSLKDTQKDKLLIAAGTGIAPMVSMVRTLLERGFGGRMTLFYGASYPRMLVYGSELAAHAQRHKRFSYVPTVSREAPEWEGERGRVETILQKYIKDASNKEAYVCGPPPMCDNTAAFLKSVGFADADVHMEKYW